MRLAALATVAALAACGGGAAPEEEQGAKLGRGDLPRATGGAPPRDLARFTRRPSTFARIERTKTRRARDRRFDGRALVSTVVTDQGRDCTTCWIFAAVAAFEAAYARAHGVAPPKLSEERVFDCVPAASCTHTDDPWTALAQLVAGGAVTADEAPYVPAKSPCGSRATHFAARPEYIGDAPSAQELKDAITALGPITVYVEANRELMEWHSPDVFQACGTRGDGHYVLLVGWDDDRGAWLIKSSWGAWGEGDSGYAWVRYGCNRIGSYAMAIGAA